MQTYLINTFHEITVLKVYRSEVEHLPEINKDGYRTPGHYLDLVHYV